MKNLELLLNRNCNLNCSYCGVKDNTYNEGSSDLKFNNFVNILNSDVFNSCKILGGEPTLNADFIKVITELSKKDIRIEVYTNSKINIDVLKESLKYNIKYIVSYHYTEMDKMSFIKNIKLMYDLKKLSSIKIMYNGNNDLINTFKLIKQLFKVPVYLEPIFNVNSQLIDTTIFEKALELDLVQFSEILNIENKYLNKTMYNMFIDKDDSKKKICNIQEHNTMYDYQNIKTFRCLTDCMNNVNSTSNICDSTYCLCDLEHIKEIL
jgi:organic radical activating enzyme